MSFDCAFYLHDDEWLFSDEAHNVTLTMHLEFVQKRAENI